MNMEKIKSDKEYEDLLEWLDKEFDKKINPDSPEGKTLQDVLLKIKEYEDEHYPIDKI
jgi:HTH-type transcriptional regulator / antitoxin HigA